jgi:hypothetical protein
LTSLSPSLLPFAIPEAGFNYFGTQAHHQSLAGRILIALGGFNVIVVTGDRLSSGPMISTALGEAAAGRYTVVGFQCEPDQDRQNVMRLGTALSESVQCDSVADRNSDLPVLLVFYDIDRYSDKQIKSILTLVHQQARIADHRITAAVFLAPTEFLARLAHPVLRAWLANRLLVARVRFHELGADEIAAFLHHQLPSGEAEKIFTEEAIAAIANVSGGDPVVINRFALRMLGYAAVSTGNVLGEAPLGSATMIAPDMRPKKSDITSFAGRRQQRHPPEPDPNLLARIWANKSVRLKLGTGITFGFACVAVLATVEFIHPDAQDISLSRTAPAIEVPAKRVEHARLTNWAPPGLAMAAVPNKAPTTMAASAEPTLEEALAVKTPAPPLSVAAPRRAPEPATPKEVPQTAVNAAEPSGAPTEVAPTATAVAPMGTQAPASIPSMPNPPPNQLRLPPTEIAALLARGDALFARGDISSARLFYERAADAGEGRAALRLGNTFDPAFLEFAHLHMRGDLAMAEAWYGRARKLGETEAEILLTTAQRHDQIEATAAQHKIAPAER